MGQKEVPTSLLLIRPRPICDLDTYRQFIICLDKYGQVIDQSNDDKLDVLEYYGVPNGS